MTHSIFRIITDSFSPIFWRLHLYALFLLAFLLTAQVVAQSPLTRSRAQLEAEKAAIQKKLREYDQILQQTTARKRNTLSELNALNQKLEARLSYIGTLNREVLLINREARAIEDNIRKLERDLATLKEEYAGMIYTSYKLNTGVNVLTFIFSASTFKQFYMRLNYLKQYGDARKKQVEQMEKVAKELEVKQVALETKRKDKERLLAQERSEKENLDKLKKEQQGIVNNLAQREDELKKDIQEAKKQQENLNRLIKRVIEEEIKLAEADAKKEGTRTTAKSSGNIPLTPEGAALSSSFEGNKGKMPWPVESGFVSKRYGTFPHPTLKGITETNDGIDIQTNNGEAVRAIFDGVVTKITTVPGMGGTVIIRHGDFYTMYSRLKTISVKSGQEISAKSIIGTVNADRNGVSELHFQTWKGLQVMDPSIWLSKK